MYVRKDYRRRNIWKSKIGDTYSHGRKGYLNYPVLYMCSILKNKCHKYVQLFVLGSSEDSGEESNKGTGGCAPREPRDKDSEEIPPREYHPAL